MIAPLGLLIKVASPHSQFIKWPDMDSNDRRKHLVIRDSHILRGDSIQGTDYIANPFFLNLKVSGQQLKF